MTISRCRRCGSYAEVLVSEPGVTRIADHLDPRTYHICSSRTGMDHVVHVQELD